MTKRQPTPKTVREAIRASVPDAKLRKARIKLTNEGFSGGAIGGFTKYEREHGGAVVELGAPIGDNAKGIVVRGHETRHATRHRPQRKKAVTENASIAGQIVDDVHIESTPIPEAKAIIPYRRAHLATALGDLRTMVNHERAVKKGLVPDNVAHRNARLLMAVRIVAMLRRYGGDIYGSDEKRIRMNGQRKVLKILGENTFKAISQVQKLAVSRRTRNRAISVLTALMENEPTTEDMYEEKELPMRESDILEPPKEGDALEGDMKITNLIPRTVPCDKEKQINTRHAPSGVIINQGRYVNAVVSGDSNGLFSRRTREKAGGTILIDASGSMHANARNLTALCELCPTATVAYYSGSASGRGELCVYALNGKRYGKELPQRTIHGGNAVDLPAIKWMMRLPKPWTLISDLGFCGGVLGSEIIAHALVERAKQRGELTVHGSLDAAYEAFGGKGELKN